MLYGYNSIGAFSTHNNIGLSCVNFFIKISLVITILDIHQDICGIRHNQENTNFDPFWVL